MTSIAIYCLRQIVVLMSIAILSWPFTACSGGGDDEGGPTHTDAWVAPELPVRIESPNYHYVTHYAPVTDKWMGGMMVTKRNFSLCFDKTKRAALWVAYPMHESYLGSGRVETWEYDPQIPKTDQPVLYKGYAKGTTWNRGHQIPNADRNAHPTMQAQTFYFTNMTPQNATLNQQAWARLEAKVRDWKCSDTLYVVTGAYWQHTNNTTTDNNGQVCPIPTHYYKVLARTRRGDVRTRGDLLGRYPAADLQTIGFWVENKSGQGEAAVWVKSVEEIETLTGLKFFPTLPVEAKRQKNAAQWQL
ncbi:MAG: DNA/RNA non-specific endonuclease [Alistipes sp.]|nr:DNA/RNA non-specific endonuclease [Alistipes sp.]